MRGLWRWAVIFLAAVGFDVMMAILGVGFVTAQNNAEEAIAAQRASAARASARISEYRAETARLREVNERLVNEQDALRRRQIANDAAVAEVRAAQQRVEQGDPSTTPPSTPAPPSTTTSTTTPPRRCIAQVTDTCIGG